MGQAMRVSTKGRYGLRAMFELAQSFGEGPVLMSAIAERQGLSRKHLHALLTSLKSAGLVRSIRGPGGGFVLSKAPGEIRLSEVLRALEGPLALVHCVMDRQACDRVNQCAARNVWQELSGTIEEALNSVTLEDLLGQGTKAHAKPGSNKKRKSSKRPTRTVKRSGTASHKPATKAGKK